MVGALTERREDRMRLQDLIVTYDRAWGEPDEGERRRLLEVSWAEDGELVDPGEGRFRGRDAVVGRIAGFSERFPGARVEVTSGLDEHHGFLRYAWTIFAADGRALLEGMDFAEVAEDGRLRRVVMFFGRLPG
jgi:hypothetical protein